MATNPVDDRANRLREMLPGLGAHAMLVKDTFDIEWLTGFRRVFDGERAHTAIVSCCPDRFLLHTDSRYIEAMLRAAEGSSVEVDAAAERSAEWAHANAIACRISEDGSDLAIEDSMSLFEHRELQAAFGGKEDGQVDSCDRPSFVETHDAVLGLRAIKDGSEVQLLKAAQEVTDRAFEHIVGFMRVGMTEREIQLELDSYMLENGADDLAFPSIVASGANGASPHAIVSNKVVEEGECVVMDFGAKRDGYCSDMTRTVFVGQPAPELIRAWDVLRTANETVEERLYIGMTGAEAHDLALDVLAEGGFRDKMGHSLGHGVGLQVHELPLLSPRNRNPLAKGNVVTVEPGIYIPGSFGMRLEDFGVMTDNGFERFTRSTHEMVVI